VPDGTELLMLAWNVMVMLFPAGKVPMLRLIVLATGLLAMRGADEADDFSAFVLLVLAGAWLKLLPDARSCTFFLLERDATLRSAALPVFLAR
jgi:hypothetical protein